MQGIKSPCTLWPQTTLLWPSSPSLNRRVSMLYQANLGPGLNKYATATEYIHAESFNDAWIRAEMMCEPYEVVQGVWPINQLNDYGHNDD